MFLRSYILEVDLNDVVEIIVFDQAYTFTTNHNVHFHGFSFAVLGIDKVYYYLIPHNFLHVLFYTAWRRIESRNNSSIR
jgi:hypothetical protein